MPTVQELKEQRLARLAVAAVSAEEKAAAAAENYEVFDDYAGVSDSPAVDSEPLAAIKYAGSGGDAPIKFNFGGSAPRPEPEPTRVPTEPLKPRTHDERLQRRLIEAQQQQANDTPSRRAAAARRTSFDNAFASMKQEAAHAARTTPDVPTVAEDGMTPGTLEFARMEEEMLAEEVARKAAEAQARQDKAELAARSARNEEMQRREAKRLERREKLAQEEVAKRAAKKRAALVLEQQRQARKQSRAKQEKFKRESEAAKKAAARRDRQERERGMAQQEQAERQQAQKELGAINNAAGGAVAATSEGGGGGDFLQDISRALVSAEGSGGDRNRKRETSFQQAFLARKEQHDAKEGDTNGNETVVIKSAYENVAVEDDAVVPEPATSAQKDRESQIRKMAESRRASNPTGIDDSDVSSVGSANSATGRSAPLPALSSATGQVRPPSVADSPDRSGETEAECEERLRLEDEELERLEMEEHAASTKDLLNAGIVPAAEATTIEEAGVHGQKAPAVAQEADATFAESAAAKQASRLEQLDKEATEARAAQQKQLDEEARVARALQQEQLAEEAKEARDALALQQAQLAKEAEEAQAAHEKQLDQLAHEAEAARSAQQAQLAEDTAAQHAKLADEAQAVREAARAAHEANAASEADSIKKMQEKRAAEEKRFKELKRKAEEAEAAREAEEQRVLDAKRRAAELEATRVAEEEKLKLARQAAEEAKTVREAEKARLAEETEALRAAQQKVADDEKAIRDKQKNDEEIKLKELRLVAEEKVAARKLMEEQDAERIRLSKARREADSKAAAVKAEEAKLAEAKAAAEMAVEATVAEEARLADAKQASEKATAEAGAAQAASRRTSDTDMATFNGELDDEKAALADITVVTPTKELEAPKALSPAEQARAVRERKKRAKELAAQKALPDEPTGPNSSTPEPASARSPVATFVSGPLVNCEAPQMSVEDKSIVQAAQNALQGEDDELVLAAQAALGTDTNTLSPESMPNVPVEPRAKSPADVAKAARERKRLAKEEARRRLGLEGISTVSVVATTEAKPEMPADLTDLRKEKETAAASAVAAAVAEAVSADELAPSRDGPFRLSDKTVENVNAIERTPSMVKGEESLSRDAANNLSDRTKSLVDTATASPSDHAPAIPATVDTSGKKTAAFLARVARAKKKQAKLDAAASKLAGAGDAETDITRLSSTGMSLHSARLISAATSKPEGPPMESDATAPREEPPAQHHGADEFSRQSDTQMSVHSRALVNAATSRPSFSRSLSASAEEQEESAPPVVGHPPLEAPEVDIPVINIDGSSPSRPSTVYPTDGERIKVVLKNAGEGFGFSLSGGAGSTKDKPLYVRRVSPLGVANLSGLVKGDFITELNGEPMGNHSQADAAAMIRQCSELVLNICRPPISLKRTNSAASSVASPQDTQRPPAMGTVSDFTAASGPPAMPPPVPSYSWGSVPGSRTDPGAPPSHAPPDRIHGANSLSQVSTGSLAPGFTAVDAPRLSNASTASSASDDASRPESSDSAISYEQEAPSWLLHGQDEQVVKLELAKNRTDIDFGVSFGVTPPGTPGPKLFIGTVVEGGAGHRAGLQSMDKILEIGDDNMRKATPAAAASILNSLAPNMPINVMVARENQHFLEVAPDWDRRLSDKSAIAIAAAEAAVAAAAAIPVPSEPIPELPTLPTLPRPSGVGGNIKRRGREGSTGRMLRKMEDISNTVNRVNACLSAQHQINLKGDGSFEGTVVVSVLVPGKGMLSKTEVISSKTSVNELIKRILASEPYLKQVHGSPDAFQLCDLDASTPKQIPILEKRGRPLQLVVKWSNRKIKGAYAGVEPGSTTPAGDGFFLRPIPETASTSSPSNKRKGIFASLKRGPRK
jgi:membrane-associated protease RseP (regulator of RpoE activity)